MRSMNLMPLRLQRVSPLPPFLIFTQPLSRPSAPYADHCMEAPMKKLCVSFNPFKHRKKRNTVFASSWFKKEKSWGLGIVCIKFLIHAQTLLNNGLTNCHKPLKKAHFLKLLKPSKKPCGMKKNYSPI